MTRDEVIRIAWKAGICMENSILLPAPDGEVEALERFATLAAEWGAKQEREACAKVCEDDVRTWSHPGSITRAECAAAIRARGEKVPR